MTDLALTERGFTVSPSQINTALECLRKWGFDKLDGIRSQPHRSARAGQRIHTILEHWLGQGVPPNLNESLVIDGHTYHPGKSVFFGMHNLPPPGPHMKIEIPFRFKHWLGRIDYGYSTMLPNGAVVPVFGDHKSTGDLKYSKTDATIKKDPQAIVYANAILHYFPKAPLAFGAWGYFGTRAPRYPSKRVLFSFTREEAAAALIPLDTIGEGLIRLRTIKGLRAMDLPPNPRSCENYGGCPHIHRCMLSPELMIRGHFVTEPTSVEEMMTMTMENLNGVHTPSLSAPPQIPQIPPTVSEEPWIPNPNDPRYEYQPIARQQRLIQQPQIPQIPQIPVVQMHAAPQPPMVQLPPIQALPVGMVNAPEAPALNKTEPTVETPQTAAPRAPKTAVVVAPDDLDGMDKAKLVALATMLGVDTKRLQEKGIRDKIRSFRAANPGAATFQIPQVQPQVQPQAVVIPTFEARALETNASLEVPGSIASQFDDVELEPVASVAPGDDVELRRDRVVKIVSAQLTAHSALGDEELVRRAVSINALVERHVGS